MNADDRTIVANLLQGQRTAALATLAEAGPFVSFVAYALEPETATLLMHLSSLAAHTRQLIANPRASLLITAGDDGRDDPQTLPRITLVGSVACVTDDQPGYASARVAYQARLPASAMLFDFSDFSLFRFTPASARYVGGFARAHTLSAEQLATIMGTASAD